MSKSKKKNCQKRKRKTYKKWMGGKPPEPKSKPYKSHSQLHKLVLSSNSIHVDQSTFKIVGNDEKISTYGLATCSALTMQIGNKKIMAHLDASMKINPIINAINSEITNQNIDATTLFPIIYSGGLHSELTLEKARNICKSVNIPEENLQISNVCFTKTVFI